MSTSPYRLPYARSGLRLPKKGVQELNVCGY